MNEIVETPTAELAWTTNVDGTWPVDRWFHRLWSDGLFAPTWMARAGPSGAGRFPMDVVERDDAFEVIADLPGIPKDRIEVRVRGTVLSIHAETEAPPEPAGTNYLRRERSAVTLDRAFELPEAIPAASLQAKVENGVLTVRIPKPVPAVAEKVPVA